MIYLMLATLAIAVGIVLYIYRDIPGQTFDDNWFKSDEFLTEFGEEEDFDDMEDDEKGTMNH